MLRFAKDLLGVLDNGKGNLNEEKLNRGSEHEA